ncbi:hypothetical protein GCM10010302_05150 [Streptomyces polychromogenes]|uniref:DUF7707 domain-containing protein n=1 Tax=Streptomyces polychromogenes TaxID=67342 RepID=A0ABN0V1N7_9ACTN
MDLDELSQAERRRWVETHTAAVRALSMATAGKEPQVNTADERSLSYECVLGDGSRPDLVSVVGTIPDLARTLQEGRAARQKP